MPSISHSSANFSDIDPVPDIEFRIVFGSYIGAVAIEVLVSGAVLQDINAVGLLSLLGAGAFVVAGAAGIVATGRWRYGPERIGGSWLRYAFLVPGGMVFIPIFALDIVTGDTASLPLYVSSAVVTLGGLVVVKMVRTRYVKSVCAESAPLATWQAETSTVAILQRFAVLAVPMIAIAFVAPRTVGGLVGGFVGGLAGQLLGSGETASAHPTGIELEKPFVRGFYSWEQFDGYRLTGRELRLERSWRLDIRWKRDRIDTRELVDVLDEYIDGNGGERASTGGRS